MHENCFIVTLSSQFTITKVAAIQGFTTQRPSQIHQSAHGKLDDLNGLVHSFTALQLRPRNCC